MSVLTKLIDILAPLPVGTCIAVQMIDSSTHYIKLVHGHLSGKRRVYVDNRRIHESREVMDSGMEYVFPPECAESLGGCHLTLWIIEAFSDDSDWLYDIEINGARLLKLLHQRYESSTSEGMQLTEIHNSSTSNISSSRSMHADD